VETYDCLRGHELEDATGALLQQVLQIRDLRGVSDEHDKFYHRNKRSHYCNSWEEFYPKIKELEPEKEERDVEQPDTLEQNAEEEDTKEQDVLEQDPERI